MKKSLIIEGSDATFQKLLKNKEYIFLVDFWADWCGPCKVMSLILEELAAEYAWAKLKVVKINIENNPAITLKYAIRGLPSFYFIKNGNVLYSQIGSTTKDDLKKMIEKHFLCSD